MNLTTRLVATILVVAAALAVASLGVSGALSSTQPHYSATSPTPPAADTPQP
jgi:hypothetical protein